MPDLTPRLLPELKNHRLPGLNLGEGAVLPYYDGLSILNLPTTLCRLFGVPELGHAPLRPEVLEGVVSGGGGMPRQVVMVLVDALALHRFRRWRMRKPKMVWNRLIAGGLLAPLTSVVPSTTSTALPSIWSGLSPAQHGLVGYELWLKEYGVVANMILHGPMSIKGSAGSLEDAGLEPEKMLPGPTLGAQLSSHGIDTHAFQHYTIVHSGLSRLFLQGVKIHSFGTAAELWINVRTLLETRSENRRFVSVYWSAIDTYSHTYGPDAEIPEAEFAHFSAAFEAYFLDRLTAEARKDTLLLLVADHGQIATPKNPRYDLKTHPNLARHLTIAPTGENRLPYFYVRPGQLEAVRESLEGQFTGQFLPLDPASAVEQGLFGPGEPHPHLRDRVGDLLALARGQAYLWWGREESPIVGRHGGLAEEEMLVPFLAVWL